MAASVVPALIDAFLSMAQTTLPNLSSYDGTGVSEDPGDYLQAGVEDPDTPGWQNSATVTQDWANANVGVNEEGSVFFTLKSWNGGASNADQKAARDAAYANLEALATAMRQNPSLGVANVLWTRLAATSLEQIQDQNGSAARLRFQVFFKSYI